MDEVTKLIPSPKQVVRLIKAARFANRMQRANDAARLRAARQEAAQAQHVCERIEAQRSEP